MFNFLKNKNQNQSQDDTDVTRKQPHKTNDETAKDISDATISFDQFSKIEMRVGEVVKAEKIQNADRLLRLSVDFGNETRKIVSGIAEYFEADSLVGNKYAFVTNLKPRKIRGEESNGMIMAARDEAGNFSLMNVDSRVSKGTLLS